MAPAAAVETVAPMEPDWCEGFKPWGAKAAASSVSYDALAEAFQKDPTSPQSLWRAAQLSCELPKDAKVQKAVAAVRQAYVNLTGETEKDSRLQMKYRADAARWDKDVAEACPKEFSKNPAEALVGIARSFVLCGTRGGDPVRAANFQATVGGLNNVWPGFLGWIYTSDERNSDWAGELGQVIEKFDTKGFLAKEQNRFLAAAGLKDLYAARQKFRTKKPKALNAQGVLAWFEQREKNPAMFEAIAAVHLAEAKRQSAFAGYAFYVDGAKPEWTAECQKLHDLVISKVPADKPVTLLEIVKAYNAPEYFEALYRTLPYCAWAANDPARVYAYNAFSGDIQTATRRDPTNFPGPSMEWGSALSPFAKHNPFSFFVGDPGTEFKWTNRLHKGDCQAFGSTGILDSGNYAGATVQSLKETPEGTVVTFKTESWQTDNMVCDNDNTFHWTSNGVLERGLKCVKKGTKTVKFSEQPMLLPKGHGVQGIKPGVYLSVAAAKCSVQDQGKTIKAYPIITYPSFKQAERKDIQSFFWWTFKPAEGGGAVAAGGKAKGKGKK